MLGQHTVADLQNLVSAADRELSGLGRGYTALCSAHAMPDAFKKSWEARYTALRTAYADARRPALAKILATKDLPGVRLDVAVAEPQYAGVKGALANYRVLRDNLATGAIGTADFGADPPSFPAAATIATHDTGAAGRLNVHASPSASGASVGTFEHLARVSVTGPSQNGFYPVQGQGTSGATITGFASAAYVSPDAVAAAPDVPFVPGVILPDAPSTPPTPAPTGSAARVTTTDTGAKGQLHVRLTPSTSGALAGDFAHGAMVTITGPVVAGFYPVMGTSVQGKTIAGFASAQFITPIAGSAPTPNAPPPPLPVAPSGPSPTPGVAPTPAPAPSFTPTHAPNLGRPAPAPVTPATPAVEDTPDHTNLWLALALLGAGGVTYGLYRKTHGANAPAKKVSA